MFTKEDRFFQIVNYLMENRKIYNQSDLANLLCIDKSYITNIKNGKKPVTDTIADKLVETFPETNREWLMDGKGQMLNVPDADAPSPACGGRSAALIPLIPIEAVAGFGTEENGGVRCEECDRYLVPDFDRLGAEFLIRVSGSSMYPKYSNGDVLACRKVREILFYQWGKIYVVDSSQGALVKRIFEDSSNLDNVLCVSENREKYPPFSIPKSDIRSLSVVVGVVRME